jgi:hypothetical protein
LNASTRWLVVVAGIISVVVIASTLVALLANGEQEFEPGTPEAAVQGYLRAVADSDATTALSYIADSVYDECADIPRDAILFRGNNDFRAVLRDTVSQREGVVVEVEITESYGGGLFGGESTWTTSFSLVRQADGEWRFSEVPWPLYCSRFAEPVPARS